MVKILVLITTLMGLGACTTAPQWTPHAVAANAALIGRVDIQQQRQLRIPQLSHIGWQFQSTDVLAAMSSTDQQVLSSTIQGVLDSLFTTASMMDDNNRVTADIDFVIYLKLLEATEERDPEVTSQRPHHALVKMSLVDARSQKLVNVSRVDARSGAIDHRGYTDFIENAITAWVRQATY